MRGAVFERFFWRRSDGPQPHIVTIQFHKKMRLSELAFYVDFKQDESYTPQKLSIRAGTGVQDLHVRRLARSKSCLHAGGGLGERARAVWMDDRQIGGTAA